MNKDIKISAYFITYNSEKIIPHLLRYYSQFCKKITIIDNCSTDNTEKICKTFDNVTFIRFDTKETFNDHANMTIKNDIWKKDANDFDYIIVGDNDEFLYHKDGMMNFITQKDEEGFTIFRPQGYHMIGDLKLDLKYDDNILEKIPTGFRISSMDKPILFNCKKIKDMNFCVGCHNCAPMGDEVNIWQDDKNFKLLHYKFLGLNFHLDRCRKLRTRLSDFNKHYKLGTYYLEGDTYHKNDYMHFYNNRKIVI